MTRMGAEDAAFGCAVYGGSALGFRRNPWFAPQCLEPPIVRQAGTNRASCFLAAADSGFGKREFQALMYQNRQPVQAVFGAP